MKATWNYAFIMPLSIFRIPDLGDLSRAAEEIPLAFLCDALQVYPLSFTHIFIIHRDKFCQTDVKRRQRQSRASAFGRKKDRKLHFRRKVGGAMQKSIPPKGGKHDG